MNLRKFFFILIFIPFFTGATFAEGNVAFVDMQYIMDNSLAGQSLKKQLENVHKQNLENFKKKRARSFS